ncbi:protein translocase subunit SecD [Enterobacteriaceae endosymbiont of Donacia sparganii]|uniref:protein translocase subunit SecD n=1 Tax=Enterobacteriaceae endosymbiont of Donacia sparganii TaxID=2675785 RepID=UPI0014499F76|nr:protein translocase subunit SecD [Enterobacteriaceae endosymbiont of Donacia sparganii]QJC35642.1 protein translocase subunit SecD [Enterobacteriaceae endosymbiont of Donacia sparganii]
MLNKYNIKQYILIILLLIFSIIYSLPNIYKDIPIIQIKFLNKKNLNFIIFNNINKILKKNNLIYIKAFLYRKNIEIIFNNIEDQLNAYKVIKNNLNIDNHFINITTKLISSLPNWLKYIKAKPINLGLDLKGGIYFLLQIDNNYVLKKIKEQNIENIKKIVNIKNISFIKDEKFNNFNYKIFFKNKKSRNKVFYKLKKKNNNIIINYKIIDNNGIKIFLNKHELNKFKNFIMEKNINVLRNRVNQIGVTDTVVQKKDLNHIIIELPGVQNFQEAKNILGNTSTLEFHLINKNNFINNKNDFYTFYLKNKTPIFINKKSIIDGSNIINATYNKNEYNKPQVNIFLDNKGSNIISKFTQKHIGDSIVTLLVNYINNKKNIKNNNSIIRKIKIINIAVIKTQVNNTFSIIGLTNFKEAKKLAFLLKSGKLSSPVKIIQEKIIGPSIGRKNIIQGIKACLIGILICIIFMVFYYKIFGIIAIIALFINILLIISFFSLLPGLTLTMSGITGIVLTLVIALNTNILINERIKEEINKKLFIHKAIYFGYKKTLPSILDINIITIINTCILKIFGSREMQGFAITTFIGIITSIFTSVFITWLIVNFLYSNKKIKKLSI